MSRESKEIYEFGAYRLNVGEHIFERLDGEKSPPLPEKAFQTLVALLRNRGRLLTKQELIDAVWPDLFVEENNLDKAIHTIRHVLAEKAAEPKYIETVRKHGYRFIADVIDVGANTGEPERLSREAPDPSYPPADIHTQINRIDAVLLQPDGSGPKRKGNNYWASVAAAMLGSAGILITGWALISSYTADKPTHGVSPLAADVPSQADPKEAPNRPAAYDLYVRGKVKVNSENRADTEDAIKLLEEAVRIDPNFAEAYAQLARGYNTISFKYSDDVNRKRFHENAEVAIEKALALDPGLAEAHFARGLILWTNSKGFPHENAIRAYKRSLELDPELDETYHQLSLVYSHIGLLNEAMDSVQTALARNPNNTLARYRTGVYLSYQGKFEEALAVYKTIPPDFTPLLVDRTMAETLIQTGRHSQAEALVDDYLNRFPQDEGGSLTSVKALLLAVKGRNDEAQQAIQRAQEIGRGYGHFHHTAYNIASAYAVMGKHDEAIKWLEIAAETGFPNYSYFMVDPNLNNIRKHPRFISFLSEIEQRIQRLKANI